jgi:hypothetical protein
MAQNSVSFSQSWPAGVVVEARRGHRFTPEGGAASLARDPDLLAEMIINAKLPQLAMIVCVKEVFFHGAVAGVGRN